MILFLTASYGISPSRAYVHNWLLKEFMWMQVFQWIKLLKNLHVWKKFSIQTETSMIYSVHICYSSMYSSWKWQDKKFNFGGEKSTVKTVLPFIKAAVIELWTWAGQLCLGILNFAYFLLVTISNTCTQSYEWFPQWICNIIEYIQPKFYLYNLKVKLNEQKSLVFRTPSWKCYFHQFMFFDIHVTTKIIIVFFCYLSNIFKYF